MPELSTIRELGAYGLILFLVAVAAVKGIPALVVAFRATQTLLIATFQQEIKNERDFARELLEAERSDHRQDREAANRVIADNTKAMNELAHSVNDLRQTVQQLVDKP